MKIEQININLKSKLTSKFLNNSLPIILELIADFVAISLSFIFQFYIRYKSSLFGFQYTDLNNETLILTYGIFAVTFLFTVIYFFFDLYKNWYERSPFEEIFAIIKANFFTLFLLYIFILYDSIASPRMLILVFFVPLTLLGIIFRTIARRAQHRLRKNHVIAFSTILVGDKEKISNFYEKLLKSPSWGIAPIGYILDKKNYDETISNIPFLGYQEDLVKIISIYKPEIVLLAYQKVNQTDLLEIVSNSSASGARVKIEPDLYHIFTGQAKTHNIYGIPLIEISPQILKPWQALTKRIFDIFFSLMVLIIGLPIWLMVAIAIKLDSKGGVFYTQPRVGLNGKIFEIYKFRSMRPWDNAIQAWTVVNDPRVTKLGRFLRKTHLDEIPQFWNVLIGDMSIVGPRPEQPKFVEQFEKEFPLYTRRLIVRPGITGWWQVINTGYVLTSDEIEKRIKYDFYYIENFSLRFDFEILIRTIWVIIRGTGQA